MTLKISYYPAQQDDKIWFTRCYYPDQQDNKINQLCISYLYIEYHCLYH